MVQKLILIIFFLNCIYSQDNTTYKIGVIIQSPLIFISDSLNFDPNNTKNTDFSGILIDIFSYMADQLNISYSYIIINSSINHTSDLILYNPADYNLDKGFDPVFYYLKNSTIDYVKTDEIIKESYYIFFPSLLATLIQKVIWELFFILFIVIVPWVLINAQIYYFFDSISFKNLPFYKGFYKALASLIFREAETKCGKIYSIYFLASTSVVCMLILADFIYAIANMLTRFDITNVYDLINNKANICLFADEKFQINFLKTISEIQLTMKNSISDCFIMIENLTVSALLISEFYIKSFLKNNENYNNIFRFYVKQNSFKSYSFLINNQVNRSLLINLNQMINIITNSELIHNILTKYLTNVEYDRLNPASILIESPILILSSLTITSMFIFAFLIIAIRRQSNKLKEPKNKNQGKISNKKPKNSNIKLLSNNTRKSVLIQNEDLESKNNTNEIINLNLSNSVTYQKIKSEMKKKMKNEEELVPNSELRKLNTNNNEFTKRQTLSLSGPIALYDLHFEKNTFELKNPQDVKDFFGDKEVSSVERISSFKSTSGLGFNFENNNEKEKNDLE